MAPSQLKQLKASLRENGLVGPQKSKKQKKQSAGTRGDTQKRLRDVALNGIREQSNPFEVKAFSRKPKYDFVGEKNAANARGRPGVTKSLGEARRRDTLLRELRRRNKSGGIIDRRFGENDPTMTPEQRAAERFARESERRQKKSSIFNLEDEEEGGVQLTHMGQSLSAGNQYAGDDFTESDLDNAVDGTEDNERPRKRRRFSDVDQNGEEQRNGELELISEPKKTRQEIMKDLIAKSKLHKYERQQAREDDEDLRAELDKGLPDFLAAMKTHKPLAPPLHTHAREPVMNPDREALLNGKDRQEIEREYNERVRQMALDQRSKPSDRIKTEAEKAAEEADRLKELESDRFHRMEGDSESLSEDRQSATFSVDDEEQDDANAFGLKNIGLNQSQKHPPDPGIDDEDDFIIDEDLVAADSEGELSDSSLASDSSDVGGNIDGEEDLINGLTPLKHVTEAEEEVNDPTKDENLSNEAAYTYQCPSSHHEFLQITRKSSVEALPSIIQRIRALYHPSLDHGNKEKLSRFAGILVQHLVYMTEQQHPPDTVLEGLIRHIHSLAKVYPAAVGRAFQDQLRQIAVSRPLQLLPKDLILLTGVSSIFPTSDHFHSIVTPSMLTLTRYLGQSSVTSFQDLAIGAYSSSLVLRYQVVAKRYVPEVMNYILNGLLHLAPSAVRHVSSSLMYRSSVGKLRIEQAVEPSVNGVNFWSMLEGVKAQEDKKSTLMQNLLTQLRLAADLWKSKSAFPEIISPAITVLTHLVAESNLQNLSHTLQQCIVSLKEHLKKLLENTLQARKPLLLHNHRPLAIKTSIPKFEDSYHPRRFNDPDRERAQFNKLRAEHKRERKAAMRELRKDANFIARESLREKKEKDAAYEQKFKKLVAQIQGEEGQAANEYAREKRKRKGKF
ncbi:MAG: hypothetical protein Q9227_003632 [Pyrenula ochraceoflavens]